MIAATPKISILMPVYQGMPYLRDAVSSILNQTLTDFELLIGDDGSTDGSLEFLQSLGDPRVRLFEAGRSKGLFANLNRLSLFAAAPLVRFFCQDDLLDPTCLEGEVAFMEQHPTIAAAITKFRVIADSGKVLDAGTVGDLPDILEPLLSTQHFFYHGCIAGNLSTVVVRRSVLMGLKTFNLNYRVSGDYELWSRIVPHYPIGILHERLVNVRSHTGQLSRSRPSGVRFVGENRQIRSKLLQSLPAEVREKARSYEYRRHHVLDFHHAVRSLLRLRFGDAFRIFSILGLEGTARAAGNWFWTLNNRRRPQAPWILAATAH